MEAMAYTLILLANSSFVGYYSSQESCEQAVRAIYSKRVDPYGYMHSSIRNNTVDIMMKHKYPREYLCQKN